MQQGIWRKLPRHFFALAPMDDVTDTVFRRIVARCGKPDLFFTEFTSTDGICSAGFERVKKRLVFIDEERPVIAQIWGTKPDNFYKSSKILMGMGFDGIDINMGCPDRKIVARGSCSGLIRNQTLAKEIIQATKEGAGSLPVSVKTRIGYGEIETEKWIRFLLEQDLEAISIHGRTVAEMSKVPAHWDEIGKAVELRNKMKKDALIVGNGDVLSLEEAREKCEKYKTDGVMIGRGIFQNLWLFSGKNSEDISFDEKMRLFIEHIVLFKEVWGREKNFDIMKNFVKAYVSGVPGANKLRIEIMALKTPEEIIDYIDSMRLS